MSTDATSRDPAAGARRPWHIGLAAFALLAILGGVVAYYGIQEPSGATPTPEKKVETTTEFITRIELPASDPIIPAGPYREEFRVACTVCHSPRLVFTQPLFTAAQWGKVVHKMTDKFGAPLSTAEEKQIVQYLHAVHGK
jgi:mono/diheme cytochrome c family protein